MSKNVENEDIVLKYMALRKKFILDKSCKIGMCGSSTFFGQNSI